MEKRNRRLRADARGMHEKQHRYLRAVLALCCVFAMHCADEWDLHLLKRDPSSRNAS